METGIWGIREACSYDSRCSFPCESNALKTSTKLRLGDMSSIADVVMLCLALHIACQFSAGRAKDL